MNVKGGETMDRQEHLQWCKARALEYEDQNDPNQAITSMISDLRKHPETAEHSAITLTGMLLVGGHLQTAAQVREHIDGFN